MKLYLWLITDEEGRVPEHAPVHGVDYKKGNPCGRSHEYHTRDCKPIVFTEGEILESLKRHPEQYVELVFLRTGKEIESIVWGE
jgi:hypothetical protein